MADPIRDSSHHASASRELELDRREVGFCLRNDVDPKRASFAFEALARIVALARRADEAERRAEQAERELDAAGFMWRAAQARAEQAEVTLAHAQDEIRELHRYVRENGRTNLARAEQAEAALRRIGSTLGEDTDDDLAAIARTALTDTTPGEPPLTEREQTVLDMVMQAPENAVTYPLRKAIRDLLAPFPATTSVEPKHEPFETGWAQRQVDKATTKEPTERHHPDCGPWPHPHCHHSGHTADQPKGDGNNE